MNSRLKLIAKLKQLESRYSTSFQSVSREGINIRYTDAINAAAEAAVTIEMLDARNSELVLENEKLKDLLFRAMEKNLIGDVDL